MLDLLYDYCDINTKFRYRIGHVLAAILFILIFYTIIFGGSTFIYISIYGSSVWLIFNSILNYKIYVEDKYIIDP